MSEAIIRSCCKKFRNIHDKDGLNQGGLNKKEIQLNLCNIFSIFIFNELYLFS